MTSTVHAFFLAMVLFPEVQVKAQAELDTVVGRERLPSFSDRDSLPYVNAVWKEVLRWHTVVPLGTVSPSLPLSMLTKAKTKRCPTLPQKTFTVTGTSSQKERASLETCGE